MTVRNSIMMMILLTLFVAGCQPKSEKTALSPQDSLMLAKVNDFAVVTLTTDLGKLTEKEKQMILLLIEVADIIDNLYWFQTLGDKTAFLDSIKDTITRQFAEINYGPWERLNGNKPFVEGYGEKPAGANFYPADMTKEEFEKWNDPNKTSQYTLIRRADDRSLKAVWYHEAYKDQITRAADLLKKAAGFAEDAGLKKYLELRAEAFLTDDYFASDMAWMDMKTNTIDFVIGPIENYEDELFVKNILRRVVLAKRTVLASARKMRLGFRITKNLPVDSN